MSNNPPPYGPPGGGQPPYGPPAGQQQGQQGQQGQQPYGQPGQPPYGQPGGQPPYGPPGGQPPYGPPGGQGPYAPPAYGTPYGPPGGFGGAPYGQPPKKWYQRWWVWLVIVVAVIIIGFVIVAVIFRGKFALESKLKEVIKDQGHSVSSVSCPNDVNTDAGHSYDCSATIDGVKQTVHVTFVTDRHFIASY